MEWIEASEHQPQDREPMLVYFVNGLMMVAYWDELHEEWRKYHDTTPMGINALLVMELPMPTPEEVARAVSNAEIAAMNK